MTLVIVSFPTYKVYADTTTVPEWNERITWTIECNKCHKMSAVCVQTRGEVKCGSTVGSLWQCTDSSCDNSHNSTWDSYTLEGHNYKAVDDRTCTSGGFVGSECRYCGDRSGSTQGALGHQGTNWVKSDSNGVTNGKRTSSCSRSGCSYNITQYLVVVSNTEQTSGDAGGYYDSGDTVSINLTSTKTGYHIDVVEGINGNTQRVTNGVGSFSMPSKPVELQVVFKANTITIDFQKGTTNN